MLSFVENTDFFFCNMYFLVERRYCTKSFLQKENDFRESYVYFFMENFCERGLLLGIKKEPSSIKAN